MTDSLRSHISFEWHRRNVIAFLTIAALLFLYFWQIGSMTPGLSPSELANVQNSHSLHTIYAHPINAPHNIFDWALVKLHLASPLYLRAVSAVFALIFIGCFYRIAAGWFGPFVGWLTTLLFATTPLVLLAGRSAGADIMYLAPLALAASYFWASRSEEASRFKFLLLVAISALYLYTPGALYLLIIGLIVSRSGLIKIIRQHPRWFGWASGLLFLAILAPLVLSLVHTPAAIKQLGLVPSGGGPLDYLTHIGWMGAALVWRSGQHFELQIGRLAILSFVQIVLAIFGLYAFWTRARSKIYGLLVLLIAAIVEAGLANQIGLLLVAVATVCVLVGAGLRYLSIEWQGVFPRNPLPRSLAIVQMAGVVLMTMYFGFRYSLLAWPHTVATKQAYVLKYQ